MVENNERIICEETEPTKPKASRFDAYRAKYSFGCAMQSLIALAAAGFMRWYFIVNLMPYFSYPIAIAGGWLLGYAAYAVLHKAYVDFVCYDELITDEAFAEMRYMRSVTVVAREFVYYSFDTIRNLWRYFKSKREEGS